MAEPFGGTDLAQFNICASWPAVIKTRRDTDREGGLGGGHRLQRETETDTEINRQKVRYKKYIESNRKMKERERGERGEGRRDGGGDGRERGIICHSENQAAGDICE